MRITSAILALSFATLIGAGCADDNQVNQSTKAGCEASCRVLLECTFGNAEAVDECTSGCVMEIESASTSCQQATEQLGDCAQGLICDDFDDGQCQREFNAATQACSQNEGGTPDGNIESDGTVEQGCERFAFVASGKPSCDEGCSISCGCEDSEAFPRSIASCTEDGCLVEADCTQICAAESLRDALDCTDTYTVLDMPDASAPDASTPDASAPDASTPDASQPDASQPDASQPDADVPDAACVKTTCEMAQAECGSIADGCGGTLDCAECPMPASCENNMCQCPPGGQPTQNPQLGTTSVTGVAGEVDWTNASAVKVSDGSAATVSLKAGDSSRYLNAQDFGFAIPTGATIEGITVAIERHSTAGRVEDGAVYLIQNGTILGTDHAQAGAWPTTSSTTTYGGATDTWGHTWTVAEINASDFSASLVAKHTGAGGPDTALVDYIEVTVTYSVTCTSP